jgi:hypothetical protein
MVQKIVPPLVLQIKTEEIHMKNFIALMLLSFTLVSGAVAATDAAQVVRGTSVVTARATKHSAVGVARFTARVARAIGRGTKRVLVG